MDSDYQNRKNDEEFSPYEDYNELEISGLIVNPIAGSLISILSSIYALIIIVIDVFLKPYLPKDIHQSKN